MELPDNSVGITDLLTYVECPRKFSYGMKRHVGRGQQSESAMPEASQFGAVYARYYGTAIHDCIHDVEDGFDDETAIQRAWNNFGEYLEPGDVDLLRGDLETYRTRDFPQTHIVASEEDQRVPLFVHPVHGQIYFRFKLDRLYERADAPGVFIHVDYKSSRHPKSQKDVDEDKQLWAYNWAIHELFPECDRLLQFYDQLRFGQVPARRKSADERRQIKDWLVKTATAVLENDVTNPDGLLRHKKNEWCAWCPIMESCPVVPELLDFARVEIEALAPSEKVGRSIKPLIEDERIDEYLEHFEDAKGAIKILERFVESVGGVAKKMPAEELFVRGYELRTRRATQFTANALQSIAEQLGEDFWALAKISKTSLESHLGDDKELLQTLLELGIETEGAQVLQRKKSA